MIDMENIDLEIPDDLSVENEEPEVEPSEDLSAVTETPVTEEPAKAKQEPGYVQGRIQKAVSKVRDEYDQQIADLKAEFEAQMAPLREQLIETQAQELVRTKKVADIETARELVRFRNGQPPAQKTQPREANGQFAAQLTPVDEARIGILQKQAQRIQEKTGIDVIAEFENNEDVQSQIVNGEMDFYELAEQMQAPKKRPPSPVRSPNGATAMNPNAIANMTDAQFDRLVKNIENGARYRLE